MVTNSRNLRLAEFLRNHTEVPMSVARDSSALEEELLNYRAPGMSAYCTVRDQEPTDEYPAHPEYRIHNEDEAKRYAGVIVGGSVNGRFFEGSSRSMTIAIQPTLGEFVGSPHVEYETLPQPEEERYRYVRGTDIQHRQTVGIWLEESHCSIEFQYGQAPTERTYLDATVFVETPDGRLEVLLSVLAVPERPHEDRLDAAVWAWGLLGRRTNSQFLTQAPSEHDVDHGTAASMRFELEATPLCWKKVAGIECGEESDPESETGLCPVHFRGIRGRWNSEA